MTELHEAFRDPDEVVSDAQKPYVQLCDRTGDCVLFDVESLVLLDTRPGNQYTAFANDYLTGGEAAGITEDIEPHRLTTPWPADRPPVATTSGTTRRQYGFNALLQGATDTRLCNNRGPFIVQGTETIPDVSEGAHSLFDSPDYTPNQHSFDGFEFDNSGLVADAQDRIIEVSFAERPIALPYKKSKVVLIAPDVRSHSHERHNASVEPGMLEAHTGFTYTCSDIEDWKPVILHKPIEIELEPLLPHAGTELELRSIDMPTFVLYETVDGDDGDTEARRRGFVYDKIERGDNIKGWKVYSTETRGGADIVHPSLINWECGHLTEQPDEIQEMMMW